MNKRKDKRRFGSLAKRTNKKNLPPITERGGRRL